LGIRTIGAYSRAAFSFKTCCPVPANGKVIPVGRRPQDFDQSSIQPRKYTSHLRLSFELKNIMWEFNIERRSAPRRTIKLEFRVLLVASKMSAEGIEQTLPFSGYTRDISESGLALLVSAKSMGVLYGLGQDYKLQLVLTLPTGSIELEVKPVRYKHIKDGKAGSSILIGAQITNISYEDRTRFVAYLGSFEQAED
jgi:hypothetical protein